LTFGFSLCDNTKVAVPCGCKRWFKGSPHGGQSRKTFPHLWCFE
jgi:hypothetical protein